MNRIYIMVSIIFIATQLSAQVVKLPTGKELNIKAIDSFLESEMESTNTPGLSFALINDAQIVYHTEKGFSRPNQPVTQETIFEGASLSKPMFGYFVMQLVEKGVLDLDVPLYKYLPYDDIAYDERYKKITARMVLSHRTGFPNWRTNREDNKLVIDFDPGTKFQYSGEGYQYLALVLQKLLKVDANGLQERFHDNVSKPLGLEVTRFIPNHKNQSNKAQAFKNNKWQDLYDQGDEEFGAAYGINTNAIDFSKWIIALMNEEGLSEIGFKELFKIQTYLPADHEMISQGIVGLTLGFYEAHLPFGKLYGHGGNNSKRFTCMFLFVPETKWGMVLFTNSGHGENMALKFVQTLMNQ